MTIYIIGFALFAAAFGFIIEIFNGRDQKIGAVAVWSSIIGLVLNLVLIYFVMPKFTHILTDGWPWMLLLNMAIPVGISMIAHGEYGSRKGVYAGVVIEVVALVCFGIARITTSPVWCNTDQIREHAGILELQVSEATYPKTDLDNVIRVPASVALSKAGNALSSGETAAIGSYLQPNRAYIQLVQSRPVYIIDLKVEDRVAFIQAGSVIPGYLLVDANDENASVEFHLGYQIGYAPYALWGKDLDRRIYTDFELGTEHQVWDTDGMEVDDEFNPLYVGSVMNHVIGFQGMDVTGLYAFDPIAGTGTSITLEEKPEWLDRVYPLEWTKTHIDLWGRFAKHDACSLSKLNQVQLDWWNDVTIPGGLEYQFTLTSMGNDPSLTYLITVNPTTGIGNIYPAKGKTIQGIKAMVEQRSRVLNPEGYVADECEFHRLLDRNTVYCILTFQSGDDFSIGGYSFVDAEMAMNNNLEDIAIATTFDEAYYQYEQIVARVSGDTSLSSTQDDIQITGTVLSNRWVNYGGEAGSYLLNVQGDDGKAYWLLARGSSLNAAAALQGNQVTATCRQQANQNYLTVSYITVEGIPDLDDR